MIRGPKDKSLFRNHPENWTGYVDPLPACHIAEGGDREYPSVSSIKQAWPKNLTDWAAKEAAKSAWKHRNALVDMTEAEAVDLIAPASDRQRDAAAGRGHTVHDLLEHHLQLDRGILLLPDDDPARAYLDTVRTIVEREQPEVLASEVIVFGEWTDDRGIVHHWSGTFDAIWRVAEHNVLVDYKSRKHGKAATRYPEEGAQLGGYSAARYWVVEDDEHGMHRMLPLQIDAAMILSIAPDAYGKYLVEDIEHARRVWQSTLQFRATQKSAPAMFARVVKHTIEGGGAAGTATQDAATTPSTSVEPSPPRAPDQPAAEDTLPPSAAGDPVPLAGALDAVMHQARVAWVMNRIDALVANPAAAPWLGQLWPATVPRPKETPGGPGAWTAEQLTAIIRCVDQVEAQIEAPFGDQDPAVAAAQRAELDRRAEAATPVVHRLVAPDDGPVIAEPTDVDWQRQVMRQMTVEQQEEVLLWIRDAQAAGVPWAMSPAGQPTPLRRLEIARAALELAQLVGHTPGDDTGPRAALALVIGEDAQQPVHRVGALLGTLTTEQAGQLAELAETHRLTVREDGRPRLEVVA